MSRRQTRHWREYTLTLAGDVWEARHHGSGEVCFSGRTPAELAQGYREYMDGLVADFRQLVSSANPLGYPVASGPIPPGTSVLGYPVAQ